MAEELTSGIDQDFPDPRSVSRKGGYRENAGRKKLKVDPQRISDLAAVGCTLNQIAERTGVSETVLSRRYGKLIKEAQDHLHQSLRSKQVQKALEGKGDTAMLIWLGKQLLGQSDKQENRVLAGNMVNDLPRPKRNVLEMPKTGTDK